MTVSVATLGFPRIGLRRELKFALESYWSGKSSLAMLQTAASGLRVAGWARQKALGADILPSNDFSLYDHVLDTSALIGAVPARYDWSGDTVEADTYFAMARGAQGPSACGHNHDTTAQEMTKWFDTNYHFMVPELTAGQTFRIASTKVFDEFATFFNTYGDVSVLDTQMFLKPLEVGREYSVELEMGKTLFIKLVTVSRQASNTGSRDVFFELNGTPRRIVVDRMLRLPPASRLACSAREGPVEIACSAAGLAAAPPAQVSALERAGIGIAAIDDSGDAGLFLHRLLARLHADGVSTALTEAGPRLVGALLAADLVDDAWIFTSRTIAGDPASAPWPALDPARFACVDERRRGTDAMARWRRLPR